MDICIVTVYDSINSGSFWQAYALGYVLKNMGHKVCYLEREKSGSASSSKLEQAKRVVKFLLKMHPIAALCYIKTIYGFQKEHKKFSLIQNNKKSFDGIDCFVLGSDTIWNLDSKYFCSHYQIFWGELFTGKKTVTYAASAANTSLEKCLQIKNIEQIVSQWTAISVRDSDTKYIIDQFTDSSVEIVCDPTLLLTKSEYQKLVYRMHSNKYVFLYLFNELTSNQTNALVDFCKENNLSIVNGITNYKMPFCDVQAINIPSNFLNYMYFAEYVITDTFHGTAFSINLQKQFIVIDRSKKKVNDLLYRLEFGDRLLKEDEYILNVLLEKIDYEKRYEAVEKFRQDSFDFLRTAIGDSDNDNKA